MECKTNYRHNFRTYSLPTLVNPQHVETSTNTMNDADEEPLPQRDASRRVPLGVFPPPIVVPPLSGSHASTIIFLHGRGSNARKFHAPLLATPVQSGTTFQEALPDSRFVFPTAAMMRATKYRRMLIHQWYDGTGDWEPEARGEMRPAVEYIQKMVRDEIETLGGDSRRVVLAGISQGCAMALTCTLLWKGGPLGAFVGMCGFMPLNESLLLTLDGSTCTSDYSDVDSLFGDSEPSSRNIFEGHSEDTRGPLQKVVDELREEVELPAFSPEKSVLLPFLSTPVFIGHGTEDPKVEYKYGQRMVELVEKMDMKVDFRTYEGLGHWYSSEMLGDIVNFLKSKLRPQTTLC